MERVPFLSLFSSLSVCLYISSLSLSSSLYLCVSLSSLSLSLFSLPLMSGKKRKADPPISSSPPSSSSSLVFPGDLLELKGKVVRLGHGLALSGDHVISTQAGKLYQAGSPSVLTSSSSSPLSSSSSSSLCVSFSHKRYQPRIDDLVVGIIVDKQQGGDLFRVDLNAGEAGSLSIFSFQGASKRNKPSLEVGALVYARVIKIDRELEGGCELSCIDPHSAKDWASGEALYGELKGGMSVSVSIAFACALMEVPADSASSSSSSSAAVVLVACGARVPYECAIGLNGRVWINAANPLASVLIGNAIVNAQHLGTSKTKTMIEALMKVIE